MSLHEYRIFMSIMFFAFFNQIHKTGIVCLMWPIHSTLISCLFEFNPYRIYLLLYNSRRLRESPRSFNNVLLSYSATYRSNEITAISGRCADDLCFLLRYEENIPEMENGNGNTRRKELQIDDQRLLNSSLSEKKWYLSFAPETGNFPWFSGNLRAREDGLLNSRCAIT